MATSVGGLNDQWLRQDIERVIAEKDKSREQLLDDTFEGCMSIRKECQSLRVEAREYGQQVIEAVQQIDDSIRIQNMGRAASRQAEEENREWILKSLSEVRGLKLAMHNQLLVIFMLAMLAEIGRAHV